MGWGKLTESSMLFLELSQAALMGLYEFGMLFCALILLGKEATG